MRREFFSAWASLFLLAGLLNYVNILRVFAVCFLMDIERRFFVFSLELPRQFSPIPQSSNLKILYPLGEPSSGFGQSNQQNRYRASSPGIDSNNSQTESDGHRERDPFVFDAKDPEYQPFDNYVVSVLGVRYELTDQFKFNCERWVDREVLKAKIDWDQLLKPNV